MSTYVCENCGKEFARTSKSKICPECRLEASRKLDKKVKELHEAGTTYAEVQKAETLANIPKIEVPEHLLKVYTPEGVTEITGHEIEGTDYIRQVNEDLTRTLNEGKAAAAEAAWYFARAVTTLPTGLREQFLLLSYEEAVNKAKDIHAALADALGIE